MKNDVIADGHTRVTWVPTIADVTQPTVAELDAGVDMQWLITADGLVGFEPTTAEVHNTALASTFDTRRAGRASFPGTLLRLDRKSTPLNSSPVETSYAAFSLKNKKLLRTAD